MTQTSVRRSQTTAPSTPSGASAAQGEAEALAALLAAEQAAVYAYGVVGGQGAVSRRRLAQQALTGHAARRDLLAGRLSALGRTPPPAAPAYALPFPVDSEPSARALAAHVEDAVAAAAADLVAAARGSARVEAARWLSEAAVAAWRWGAAATSFPGLPERSAQPRSTS